MRRLHRAVAAALLAVSLGGTLAGCGGDRDLWARYRAEKMLWMARQDGTRAEGKGTEALLAGGRAAEQLEAVMTAFPASVWTSDEAWERPVARDVAGLAGAAALLRAELDERAGRDLSAELRYARAAAEFGRVDSVQIMATAGRARSLERLDRLEDACAAWSALAQQDPATGPRGAARRTVLAAPERASKLFELLGDRQAADSCRRASAERLEIAAMDLGQDSTATRLRVAAASLLVALGDEPGARAALCRALDTARSESARSAILLALVERSRVAALPETARFYWQQLSGGGREAEAREAELMLARAWEATGVADSALAVYKRLIDRLPGGSDLSARARLGRALLLERLDRWEIARAELRTLATLYPMHECGLAALVRVVRHSVEEGDIELAGVEARHALAQIDDLLATQGDPAVRLRVHRARAELLSIQGRAADASHELWSVWTLDPRRPGAAEAGWFAARLADTALADPVRARTMYSELARQTIDLDMRRRARVRLGQTGKDE